MYFLQKQHKACSVNPNNNVLIKSFLLGCNESALEEWV